MTTLEQQPTRPSHRAHRTPRRTPDAAGLRAAQPFTPSYRCSRCRAFALYSPFGKHAGVKVSLAALSKRCSRSRCPVVYSARATGRAYVCGVVLPATLSNHCVLSLVPLTETTAHPPHDASRRCGVPERGEHVRRKRGPDSPPFLSARPRHRPETTRPGGFGARSAAQYRS